MRTNNLSVSERRKNYAQIYFALSLLLVILNIPLVYPALILVAPLFEIPLGVFFFITIKKVSYRIACLAFIAHGLIMVKLILNVIDSETF